MTKRNRSYKRPRPERRPRPDHSYADLSTAAFIEEANRPGHVCGTFVIPCTHHGSLHCLACCIRQGQS